MTTQELSPPATKAAGAEALWFERLYAKLRLPFLVGAFLFGGVMFLALQVAVALSLGLMEEQAAMGSFYFTPIAAIVGALAQGGGRMARRRVEQLNEYAATMGGGKIDLRPLYSVRNFLGLYVVMQAIIQPVYTFYGVPQTIPLEQRIAVNIPFIYWNLFLSAFFWVWIYSVYSARKIGRQPLQLKPFTEDRNLGLKPFGPFRSS